MTGQSPAEDVWECDHGWIWNTRSLQGVIAKSNMLTAAVKAPIFLPFAKNLTLVMYDTLALKAAHEPSLLNNLADDYMPSSMKTIAMNTDFINVWQRKWTEPLLQDKVVAEGTRVRSQSLNLDRCCDMAKCVDRALTEHTGTLCSLLGREIGHTLLGFVYAMFDSSWLQVVLQGGPWPFDSETATGVSRSLPRPGSMGRTSFCARHWCGELLYLAIILLCPQSMRWACRSHRSQGPSPHPGKGHQSTGPWTLPSALTVMLGLACRSQYQPCFPGCCHITILRATAHGLWLKANHQHF